MHGMSEPRLYLLDNRVKILNRVNREECWMLQNR